MKRQDLQRAFGDAPDEFRLRLRQTLDGLEERKMKQRYKLSTVLIAAVLLIAVLAGAGIAANELGVFHLLTDTAIPIFPLEGAEEMVSTNLGSVENEYATFSVEQAVFDGQGLLIQCRLTPKDTEKYVLFDAFMQNIDTEQYIVEESHDEIDVDEYGWSSDEGEYLLTKKNGEWEFTLNGEKAEMAGSIEEACERGMMFFEQDGKVYYSYTNCNVLGRKDGKEILDYWVHGYTEDDLVTLDTGDVREEEDGSIIWWMSGMAYDVIDAKEVTVNVGANVQLGNETYAMDEISFTLDKSEQERKYSIVPEDDSLEECFPGFSGSMVFTKVRGYLKLECDLSAGDDSDADLFDVDYRLYNLDGTEINVGSGGGFEENGKQVWYMEMQSVEEVPEAIILEARNVENGKITMAKVECKIVAE